MEPLDVVEHVVPGLGQCQVAATMDAFALELAEEALQVFDDLREDDARVLPVPVANPKTLGADRAPDDIYIT